MINKVFGRLVVIVKFVVVIGILFVRTVSRVDQVKNSDKMYNTVSINKAVIGAGLIHLLLWTNSLLVSFVLPSQEFELCFSEMFLHEDVFHVWLKR